MLNWTYPVIETQAVWLGLGSGIGAFLVGLALYVFDFDIRYRFEGTKSSELFDEK